MRWIVNDRGRMVARELESGQFGACFAIDPLDYGWRRVLDSKARRALLRAALGASRPDPVTVQLRCADGQRRWCKIRLVRVPGPEDRPRWFGTIEDIHDRRSREARALAVELAESEEHHRWSVALSPQVPWTAAPDGRIEEVGPRWEELTGLPPAAAQGSGWINAVHPDDCPRVLPIWYAHLDSGEPVDLDYRIRARDGQYRWMRARASARRDKKGRILRWYGTLEDIHAQKLDQQALAESEERFRLAVQSAKLGIWDFDVTSHNRSWSPEFRQMLGLGPDVPASIDLALGIVHEEDRPVLYRMAQSVAQGALPPHFEATLRIHRADTGELRWIKSSGWTTRGQVDHPSRIIITFLDVTEERNAEERIRWAATRDAMTGFPNRAEWQSELERAAAEAKRAGRCFGLLLFDIDDLKRTNDSLGHDFGDALLCGFAAQLEAVAPEGAVLGRLGGDEFGMIVTSITDADALIACGTQLLDTVRGPYAHNGRSLDCGISIGAALFGDHADAAEDLLKAADLALNASKAAGRGRITLFQSTMRAEAQQRSAMIRMARHVLADRLVLPHYQPKVDLRTGAVLGHEALLRWNHARRGPQPPATIAAAFDNYELAVQLTQAMLDAVIGDLAAALRAGMAPGPVAVNASTADFMHGDFADRLLTQLARQRVPADLFEVEVTETVFLGHGTDQVAQALERFARAGVRIALDDFGTGFASLSHLKQFPVDVIKIDRSFVCNIEHDAGDAAIVEAIVKLGSSLRMTVVAEGVETEAQAALLRQLGCSVAQGYHFGRPRPWSQVIADLRGEEG